jgi:hypothetical protein
MMEIATDGAPIELPEGFIPPGVLKKYVHDYNGFGSKEHATRDDAVFHQCARAFLGQTAISESKTVHPT